MDELQNGRIIKSLKCFCLSSNSSRKKDVKMDVFPDFIQIQRYINGEERLFEWNLEEVLSGKTVVPLLNGDLVRIKSISNKKGSDFRRNQNPNQIKQ